jgi:hypothetical protein
MRALLQTRLQTSLVVVLLAGSGVACQPSYGEVDFRPISSPPTTVAVRSHLIEIPAGMAVGVRAELDSDNDNDFDSSHDLDLIPQDRDVMVVQLRPHPREFIFVGVAPGETCLEVFIESDSVDCIEVEITAQ